MVKTLAYLDYRRSVESNWDALSMVPPFLRYELKTDTVAGLSDGGPYDGRIFDGIGSSR